MSEDLRPTQTDRYSLLKNSPDMAATYLALEAIAKYPQFRPGAAHLIAEYLLKSVGKPYALTLVQANSAKIDGDKAWEYTRRVHGSYGIGTDKKEYRNPENPESPQVHPKNPDWLAEFVKEFIYEALELIKERVWMHFSESSGTIVGEDGVITFEETDDTEEKFKISTVEDLQQTLLENLDIIPKIIQRLEPVLSDIKANAKKQRALTKQEAEEKYGPGGVKYD